MHALVIAVATFFYSGLAPKAPGTCGTLASVAVILLCYAAGMPVSMFVFPGAALALVVLYGIGWTVTHFYMKETGKHDPKEVVIDETLGIYLAYVVFFSVFPLLYRDIGGFLLVSLLLFVAFRFFDILKPFPVSFFDKNMDNAHGVMLDDAMAGVYAGILCAGGYCVYRQFFL